MYVVDCRVDKVDGFTTNLVLVYNDGTEVVKTVYDDSEVMNYDNVLNKNHYGIPDILGINSLNGFTGSLDYKVNNTIEYHLEDDQQSNTLKSAYVEVNYDFSDSEVIRTEYASTLEDLLNGREIIGFAGKYMYVVTKEPNDNRDVDNNIIGSSSVIVKIERIDLDGFELDGSYNVKFDNLHCVVDCTVQGLSIKIDLITIEFDANGDVFSNHDNTIFIHCNDPHNFQVYYENHLRCSRTTRSSVVCHTYEAYAYANYEDKTGFVHEPYGYGKATFLSCVLDSYVSQTSGNTIQTRTCEVLVEQVHSDGSFRVNVIDSEKRSKEDLAALSSSYPIPIISTTAYDYGYYDTVNKTDPKVVTTDMYYDTLYTVVPYSTLDKVYREEFTYNTHREQGEFNHLVDYSLLPSSMAAFDLKENDPVYIHQATSPQLLYGDTRTDTSSDSYYITLSDGYKLEVNTNESGIDNLKHKQLFEDVSVFNGMGTFLRKIRHELFSKVLPNIMINNLYKSNNNYSKRRLPVILNFTLGYTGIENGSLVSYVISPISIYHNRPTVSVWDNVLEDNYYDEYSTYSDNPSLDISTPIPAVVNSDVVPIHVVYSGLIEPITSSTTSTYDYDSGYYLVDYPNSGNTISIMYGHLSQSLDVSNIVIPSSVQLLAGSIEIPETGEGLIVPSDFTISIPELSSVSNLYSVRVSITDRDNNEHHVGNYTIGSVVPSNDFSSTLEYMGGSTRYAYGEEFEDTHVYTIKATIHHNESYSRYVDGVTTITQQVNASRSIVPSTRLELVGLAQDVDYTVTDSNGDNVPNISTVGTTDLFRLTLRSFRTPPSIINIYQGDTLVKTSGDKVFLQSDSNDTVVNFEEPILLYKSEQVENTVELVNNMFNITIEAFIYTHGYELTTDSWGYRDRSNYNDFTIPNDHIVEESSERVVLSIPIEWVQANLDYSNGYSSIEVYKSINTVKGSDVFGSQVFNKLVY